MYIITSLIITSQFFETHLDRLRNGCICLTTSADKCLNIITSSLRNDQVIIVSYD